jgi:hypothetical protein
MAKKKKVEASPTVTDKSPAPPDVSDVSKIPVEIDGKEYCLSFEFSALAEAERFFRRQGHPVSLLFSLPELGLSSVREVFPCAAHKHHPDLSFEEAQALITMKSVYNVATAILQAWDGASAKNAAVPAK